MVPSLKRYSPLIRLTEIRESDDEHQRLKITLAQGRNTSCFECLGYCKIFIASQAKMESNYDV